MDDVSKLRTSLENISNQIYNIYKNEKLDKIMFIFIGATPAYLFYYIEKYKPEITSKVLIPISGLSLLFQKDYYYHNKYLKYKKKYIALKKTLEMRGGNYTCLYPNATYLKDVCIKDKEGIHKNEGICIHECLKKRNLVEMERVAVPQQYKMTKENLVEMERVAVQQQYKMTKEYYEKFCEYISRYIKSSDTEYIDKFVLIDHSHTGKSITNLVRLLKECNNFKNKNFDFCNLVDNVTPISMIKNPTGISNIHIIRGVYINDMSGHIFPRLTKQIHFSTIINSTEEKLSQLLKDETELKKGHDLRTKL